MPRGAKLMPYGLERLKSVREAGFLTLIEGESDCWTLWTHGCPALGIPGAKAVKVLAAEHLAGIGKVYAVQETDPAGADFIARLTKRLLAIGYRGAFHVLHLPAKDVNELHKRNREGFKVAFEAALAEAERSSVKSDRAAVIEIRPGERARMTDEAEAALIQHDQIYQRGGYLARLVMMCPGTVHGITRSGGSVAILPLDAAYLLDRLNRLVHWQELKEGEPVACNAPDYVATALLARSGWWKFKPLAGVITAPTLRPDGSILDAPGYDTATGLMFVTDQPFEPIPAHPTEGEARAALDFVIHEVLSGFPFAEPHDRSAALSASLTAAVRHALRHAPLHTFSAPRMGSGKTLLADVVSLIATGRRATLMTYTRDPDEQRKRILSVLMQGDSVINLDNIEELLQGDSLCAVLTSETFTDRLLGSNRTVKVPTNCTWLATGNNLQVQGDITTRIVPCMLDPQCEHPEEREFERDLSEWIPEHRPELIRACLTVLRAYIVAGKPRQPIKTFGRFEEWSGLIRSALIWLGEPDPLIGRAKLERVDPVRERLRALLLVSRRAHASRQRAITALACNGGS